MGNRITEKCGIFGVYGAGFQAARLVHPGLWALQHRGQESSGISSSNGKNLRFKKGNSLENAIRNAWPFFTGAFCILVMDEKKIVAVRDRCGIRPLFEKGNSRLDIFEFVYFARPDAQLLGKSVDQIRQNLGKEFWR